MPKVNRSDTQYSIFVRSDHPLSGGMTVGALRDFVRALDAEEIPDSAALTDEHHHDTKHLTGLWVRHVVTVATSEGDGEA